MKIRKLIKLLFAGSGTASLACHAELVERDTSLYGYDMASMGGFTGLLLCMVVMHWSVSL